MWVIKLRMLLIRWVEVLKMHNIMKWAVTCDFQQCGILTSVDSYEPVQPPFKLRNSKWCLVNSLTLIEYSMDWQSLGSDCVYAQAGLSLCLLHISHCWKSRVAAQMYKIWNLCNFAQDILCIFCDSNSKINTSRYHIYLMCSRPPEKSAYWKTNFLTSQPKHMLWVLKRTVSVRRFFWAPKTHV